MSEIHVKDGESIDSALKRFKRSCAKAGVIAEVRKCGRESIMRAPASSAARSLRPLARTTRSATIDEKNVLYHLVRHVFSHRFRGNSRGRRSRTSGNAKKAAEKPIAAPVRSFCDRVSASS